MTHSFPPGAQISPGTFAAMYSRSATKRDATAWCPFAGPLICLLGSRDYVPATMTTPGQSKALVRRLVEIVNAQELDGLDEVASGQVAEEARRWVGPFRDSFPDFHMEVEDVIAEGDKVVAYFKCSGTHRGGWRGIPPTGKRFEDVDEIYIFRVEDGKLAGATAVVEDNLTRVRQLGIQP